MIIELYLKFYLLGAVVSVILIVGSCGRQFVSAKSEGPNASLLWKKAVGSMPTSRHNALDDPYTFATRVVRFTMLNLFG